MHNNTIVEIIKDNPNDSNDGLIFYIDIMCAL